MNIYDIYLRGYYDCINFCYIPEKYSKDDMKIYSIGYKDAKNKKLKNIDEFYSMSDVIIIKNKLSKDDIKLLKRCDKKELKKELEWCRTKLKDKKIYLTLSEINNTPELKAITFDLKRMKWFAPFMFENNKIINNPDYDFERVIKSLEIKKSNVAMW